MIEPEHHLPWTANPDESDLEFKALVYISNPNHRYFGKSGLFMGYGHDKHRRAKRPVLLMGVDDTGREVMVDRTDFTVVPKPKDPIEENATEESSEELSSVAG